jgi:hypothetical protein
MPIIKQPTIRYSVKQLLKQRDNFLVQYYPSQQCFIFGIQAGAISFSLREANLNFVAHAKPVMTKCNNRPAQKNEKSVKQQRKNQSVSH